MNQELLKEVLSVPTFFGEEDNMINFLKDY